MTVPLTLDQALRLLPTVAGIARAGVRLTAEGHQRHALAIAARRAASEIGIDAAAAAIGAVDSPCAVRTAPADGDASQKLLLNRTSEAA